MNSLILMSITNHTKEQAREFLKQEALNEIREILDFTHFYRRVFYVFAKYGLQLEAKEEEFFSGDEWSYSDCRDELIEKVTQFLNKHIR